MNTKFFVEKLVSSLIDEPHSLEEIAIGIHNAVYLGTVLTDVGIKFTDKHLEDLVDALNGVLCVARQITKYNR